MLKNFIIGFFKVAMPKPSLGIKALRPQSSAGKLVGNKPSSGVAMASAAKSNPIPTASHPGKAGQSMAHQHTPVPTKATGAPIGRSVGAVSI